MVQGFMTEEVTAMLAVDYLDQDCLCSTPYVPGVTIQKHAPLEKTALLPVGDDRGMRSCLHRILQWRPGPTTQQRTQLVGLEAGRVVRKATNEGREVALSATEYRLLELFAESLAS